MKSFLVGLSLSALVCANAFSATPSFTPAELSTLATIAVIDQNEILVSSVAANKGQDSDTKDFAQLMIKQHSANLTTLLTMTNNSASFTQNLTRGTAGKLNIKGSEGRSTLGALKGQAFDQAYADAMVNGHTAALQLIDTQLMKTAQSAEMKQFLSDTRAAVVKHLEYAKELQKDVTSQA